MAYAALTSLQQTTGLVLNPLEYSISVAEREKIRSIREFVMLLISFLEDFPDRSIHLEAKIRDLSNETEDIIEDFMWKQKRMPWSGTALSSSQLLQQLRAEKIGSIVGEIMDERAVGNSSSAVSSSQVAITSQKDVVIGLEDDLMKIKDRLCGGSFNSSFQVLPIVGMGGIGKTTLARSAFDDPLIVDHFHIRAWVTVSQDYSEQRILSSLIDSMKSFITEKQKNDDCATTVYQTLKYRRYLVVLDDVWSTKVWDDLRMSFPDDGNGSRVILTSRLSDIAAYPDSRSPLHEMRFMDDDQSWNLLQQKVGSFPSDLEDAGKTIARRCAGLPLAVVLVAGVLTAVSKTKGSWEEIATTVNPAVKQELEAILSLSYRHLPHRLRPCLLFIGCFPGDRTVDASRITRLWVADGFLKHRDGCSLEEEAEEYLEDLVKRNLVNVNSRNCDGKIKSCSVHDMVRDLCISKARDENFLRVVDDHVLPQGLMNDRRIRLSDGVDIDNIWGPTIHTILCFKLKRFHSWQAFWGRSRLLKVLDSVVLGNNEEIPAQVFELFHLRYLALFNYMNIIPSDISNLVNLQTLIIHPRISGRFRKKWRGIKSKSDFSLPLGIWRMGQLRHLFIYVPHTLPPPPDLDGAELLPLENLLTLLHVKNLAWVEKVLQMIPNVKRLGLVYTGNEEYGLQHLKHLYQLEKLEILGYHLFYWRRNNPHFPTTLKKLTLVGGGFPWKDMGIIGSLPNLQVLKLLDNACHGNTWEVRDDEFPQLMSLLIDTSSLMQWITQTNSFPRLKFLVLRSCLKLSEIPEDIAETPTLEMIEVYQCSMSLVMSARKIKVDQESYGNDTLQVRIVGRFTDARVMGIVSSSAVSTTGQKDVVVGLDGDLIEIKERLCGGSDKLQVLPIVGMSGIGKTTLARNAFDDPRILDHFPIRAWVTVSQEHSEKKILSCLMDSLKLFVNELLLEQKNYDREIVVRETLMYRRYLIVLDDVWSTTVWDYLRIIFPDTCNGSRIMLTTRLLDVAAYPNSDIPLHEMRLMNNYQSWNLLQKKVGSFPYDWEDAGRKIVRRCAGLPLAVVLVAGVLSAVSKTGAFWEKIAFWEEIAKAATPAVGKELKAILSLSYTHLPHHLRPCLLFIGCFPGDRIIYVSRLTKLWVAEGFLKHGHGCSLEEEAEEYLEDLVKRNLVTVNSRKCDGKIKSCSVHDMVRDLCISKAHDEKFLRVVDDHVLPQGLMNDRRICLSRVGITIRNFLCFKVKNFRSLVAFWGRSRLLRVRYINEEIPAQVFELIHLRYLALSNYMKIIPSEISNLVNLQTLIIHPSTYGSFKMKWTDIISKSDFSLPLGIWRMGQLRHLLMYVPHTLPPPPDLDIGAELLPLENLLTLLHVKNLAWNEKVLQMIPNVKRLGLVYTGNEEYGLHHLKDLHELENLKILGYDYFCWLGKKPNFPSTLKKLTLVGGEFPWEDMGIVGSLPNLQVLKLLDNACHGDTWEVRDDEFPQLMSLLIDTSSLMLWITQTNSFPRLKFLVLRFCLKLSEIPEDIAETPTLELIEVDNRNMSLVMSAEKIKEDQVCYRKYSPRVRICEV